MGRTLSHRKRNWLVLVVLLSMSTWAWADGQEGVVHTRDGLTYEGVVDENDKGAVVNMHGIDITVPRENIASINYGDFVTRWKADYAKLAKADSAGRVTAGRKAMDNHHYDLAETAFREAIDIDPNNATAADLLNFAVSQRRMEHNQAAGNSDGGDNASSATPGAPGTVKPLGLWTTLAPPQINRVKQLESRDTDTMTRFAFDNGVRKKFYDDNPQLQTQTATYADFLKQTNAVQAMQIIKSGSDLAKDVRIVNDPDAIQAFRRDVLPLVLQGCATSACHGGNNAASGKMALIAPAPDAAAVYTDFYVLQSISEKQPVAANSNNIVNNTLMPDIAMMIDRTRPEASLLLQYGLPDLQSQTKHPYVRGYNGIFRNHDDAKYQTILKFIGTLNPIVPDYGISFKLERIAPPESKPVATQPAPMAAPVP